MISPSWELAASNIYCIIICFDCFISLTLEIPERNGLFQVIFLLGGHNSNSWHWHMPGTVPHNKYYIYIICLILTTTLGSRYYYYLLFKYEEEDTEKLSNLPNITQLVVLGTALPGFRSCKPPWLRLCERPWDHKPLRRQSLSPWQGCCPCPLYFTLLGPEPDQLANDG